MVTMPGWMFAVLVLGLLGVVVVLVLQKGQAADREVQRQHQIETLTRDAITRGIHTGKELLIGYVSELELQFFDRDSEAQKREQRRRRRRGRIKDFIGSDGGVDASADYDDDVLWRGPMPERPVQAEDGGAISGGGPAANPSGDTSGDGD